MEYELRPATRQDADALAAIEIATWRVAFNTLMPEAYLAQLSEAHKAEEWRLNLIKHGTAGRKRVRVAVSESGLIGFVRAGTLADEDKVGMVYLLYVLPAHWGHGAGRALMHAAMDDLCELGMTEANLWVLRDNLRARRFYETLGWSPDGQTGREDFGGVMLETVRYRRRLTT